MQRGISENSPGSFIFYKIWYNGENRRRVQIRFFEEETQLERRSKLGDFLERLKVMDFESFHPTMG